MIRKIYFQLLLAVLVGGFSWRASAQGTVFFYQGQLSSNGSPASAPCDFRFAIYDAATNGNAISYPQTNFATVVSSGLFTATLDFGPIFSGTNYWLAIGVRTNGSTNAFTMLWPRQALLPVPYAMFATSASNLLGTLPATQITGTLPSAQLAGTYLGAVNFTNSTNTFFGKFYGNGLFLTNLNASLLATGTVADARLSTNVALLNQSQTNGGANVFTGTNTFTSANAFTGSNSFTGLNTFANGGNNFTGTFFGNGTNLTSLNASQLTGGTVADARLSTNVALLNQSQTNSGANLFTGANNFANNGNSFVGSFFGNGLVGWIPVSGTNVSAVRDTGYLLLNTNLTTVTLPLTNSLLVGDIVRISGAGSGGWKVAQTNGQSIAGIFYSPTNASWIQANASPIGWWAMASSADGVKLVAAAGGGGGISVSPDSGQTWNSSSATYSPTVLASSADGTRLVGAIRGGSVILSANTGTTWSPITAGSIAWSGIASSTDGSKFAACISNSAIFVWNNYGATSNFTTAPFLAWSGVACSADCSRLAATVYGGGIYTSANSGSSWSLSGAPSANWSCLASSADGYKLAAAVTGGRIYTSTDAGVTWTVQTNAPIAAWSAITCSSDGGRLAAIVNNGGIYVSANYGLTWTKQSLTDQYWRAIAGSADGAKLAAGFATTLTSGGIYYWHALSEFTTTTPGVNGSLTGGQGSAVELQYLGNGAFMPVSSVGIFWAN